MSSSQSPRPRKRSSSPSSRELAQRVEQIAIHDSDEEFEAEVVCNLNFEDHNMTDERTPHNEISHKVSAPHLHRDPRAAEMVTTLADGSIDIVKYCLLFKESIRTGNWTDTIRFSGNVPESAWDILFGTDRDRKPPAIK